MKRQATTRSQRKGQQGYAMLLIMFFLAILVMATIVAAPTVISSVQREKEKEMVWRGRQYTRGIRMYYMKMKRFPTSLDDLTKPKTGLRFMRQAYKDPMNPDGSWRLIYVGPNGQLIGSLNPQNQGAFGMFGAQAGMGAAQNVQNTAFGGSRNSFGNSTGGSNFGSGSSAFGTAQATGPGNTMAGGTTGNMSGVTTDPNAQNDGQLGTPQPLATMDSTNTIGGNIIGVGSKINKKSFLWYQKAKTYRQFEFIWDPSKDMGVGGASRGIGTPVQNMTGPNATGLGPNGPSAPGTGINGGQNGINGGQNPPQNLNNLGDPGAIPPLQAPPVNP